MDVQLSKHGKTEMLTRLHWGVCLKALTQLAPAIEMYTGVIATELVGQLQIKTPILKMYLTTMVDGFLLSICVLILMGLVGIIRNLYQARRTNGPVS